MVSWYPANVLSDADSWPPMSNKMWWGLQKEVELKDGVSVGKTDRVCMDDIVLYAVNVILYSVDTAFSTSSSRLMGS